MWLRSQYGYTHIWTNELRNIHLYHTLYISSGFHSFAYTPIRNPTVMAGVAREEERGYNKKHNSFKSRKNSYQGPRRDGSNPPTPSPSTPVSPGPSLPRMLEHVPVNGFNSQEISDYLNQNYSTVWNTYQDRSIPDHEKPELYKSGEMAWGKPVVWGQKGSMMENGKDFLTELRKGLEGVKKG